MGSMDNDSSSMIKRIDDDGYTCIDYSVSMSVLTPTSTSSTSLLLISPISSSNFFELTIYKSIVLSLFSLVLLLIVNYELFGYNFILVNSNTNYYFYYFYYYY